jgi:HEPN domain-containing protein
MNHSNNSTFLEDWKRIARLDWQRIKRNIKENDAVAAGFFLQQSLEKFMKSFLLLHGWKLKKIHKLDTLLDEAVKYNPELEPFYDLCERVSVYYMADRYPPFGAFDYNCDDIQKDLQESELFIKSIFPDENLECIDGI